MRMTANHFPSGARVQITQLSWVLGYDLKLSRFGGVAEWSNAIHE